MVPRPDPNEPDDAALLDRCRADDVSAWQELVRRYRRLVYSVPRRHGLSPDRCDDVFQETFQILVAKVGGLRNPSGLPKWMAETARRVTLRAIKRDGRRGPVEPEGTARAVDDLVATWEIRRDVAAALDDLGQRCRELLVALVRSGDAGYASVADRLGIPIGSLGPTRGRCLERLAERLRAQGFFDGARGTRISKPGSET